MSSPLRARMRFQLLFSLSAAGGLMTCAHAQTSDYYIVDGQRIPLTRSTTLEAVEVKPGTDDSFRAAASTVPNVTVESSPILERYDIVLIRKPPAAPQSAFSTSMRRLNSNTAVEASVPVYEIGGIEQVLVNEFLVEFKTSIAKDAAEGFLKQQGAEVVTPPGKIPNRYVIRFPAKTPREALNTVNGFNGQQPIAFAEPNFVRVMPARPRSGAAGRASESQGPATPQPRSSMPRVPAPSVGPSAISPPNDPIFGSQWALRNPGSPGIATAHIDALKGWEINKGTNQVTVAIIDEGVDVAHPDLQAKIVTPYDATDRDNNQQPNAWDGHGTACAGIAAASTHNGAGVSGVSWGARILPVRIALSNTPGGPWITSNAIIEDGIRESVDRGANVLSNSWGGGSPSSAINSAIDYAISKNRVVVFAAGNDSGAVSYPASLSATKTIVTVSATNEWDQFKTKTSNDGENWWGSNFGPQVTISAPGVHMFTTDVSGAAGYDPSDYVPDFNGTSSATPLVAGAAAVLISQHQSATPAQVRQWLTQGATDLGTPGFDNQFGHGRLNLFGALSKVPPPPTPPKVSLQLERPNDALKKGRTMAAIATVTRGSAPVSGSSVTFSSANTQLASIIPPAVVSTDAAGVAKVQVRSETNDENVVQIAAQIPGSSDSKPLKVPAWPLWAIGLAAIIALARRLR